jgi:hypothetical protein
MKHAFFLAAGVSLAFACTLDDRRPSVQETFAQHLDFPGLTPVPGPLVPGSSSGAQPVAVPLQSRVTFVPSGSWVLNVPWLGGPIAAANVQVDEHSHYSTPAGSAGEQESGTVEINVSLDSGACTGLAPICHEVTYSTQVVTTEGSASLIVVSASIFNCSGGDCAPRGDQTVTNQNLADQSLGDSGLFVRDVLGFYSGDWGDMLLRQVGDEVWGAYTYNEGTVVGSIADGAFRGWWSEAPSQGSGEVEFRWTRTEAGQVALDGRWRRGVDGTWREDWDVELVTDRDPAPELEARFDDTTLFQRHP